MGLLSRFRRQRHETRNAKGRAATQRVCRFEQLEPRIALSCDPGPELVIGATYLEQSSPEAAGDRFEVVWVGGGANTQLTHLVISGDQDGNGFDDGDVFFDIDSLPPGVSDFASFLVISPDSDIQAGQITSATLANGGADLVLDITGWDAGEKLVFTIDVDERDDVPNSQVEGAEFELANLTATFTTTDGSYQPITAGGSPTGRFFDDYSLNAALTGLLPADTNTGENDPSAGASYSLQQTPNPITISGTVYHDQDLDGFMDGSEGPVTDGGGNPISVTLELWEKEGSVYVFTGQTTTTDSNGNYSFTHDCAGTFQIREQQPPGYFSTTPDVISEITVDPGQHSAGHKFGEALPATLSGHVYEDNNDNGIINGGEAGIGNTTVTLRDGAGNLIDTTTTNGSGFYQFTNLDPTLTYSVIETQPAPPTHQFYFDGQDTLGTLGGDDSVNDQFRLVSFTQSGQSGTDYDFGELKPASLSGYVYEDLNDNDLKNGEEPGISGVTLRLLDGAGNPVLDAGGNPITATTNGSGFYRFTDLDPRLIYGVLEFQPAGYFDGQDQVGTAGGTEINHPLQDRITNINGLAAGVEAVSYNFGELPPASLSGRVILDEDCDHQLNGSEPGIGGVTIQLLDGSGNPMLDGSGNPITTVTAPDGTYHFDNLDPRLTYGLREIQLAAYIDGDDHVGTAGGVTSDPDSILLINGLSPGEEGENYDFIECPRPSISGFVFQDGPPIVLPSGVDPSTIDPHDYCNGRTPDDTPLAGVLLRLADEHGNFLLDSGGNFIETHTDANGYYEFTGLDAGTYTVVEFQPAGYLDGLESPGTTGGIVSHPGDSIARITVTGGQHSENNNFCELAVVELPPPPPPPPLLPPPPGAPPVVTETVPTQMGPGPGLAPPLAPPGGPAANIVFVGGGSTAAPAPGNTFHLSVVDAGRPRGEMMTASTADADFRTAATNLNVFTTAHAQLDDAHWLFASSPGERANVQYVFGSPDGIPVTGDFDGDGKTEVGVYRRGEWFIDVNGNGQWDEKDLWARLGTETDLPVTGDWDGDGKTDIGIYGPEWPSDPRAVMLEPGLPDRDNDTRGEKQNLPPQMEAAPAEKRQLQFTASGKRREEVIDHTFYYGHSTDIPVAGDWNGDGVWSIGVFTNGVWILDENGDGRGDTQVSFGQAGDIPVVGDWDSDGVDNLGVYRQGEWILDTNNNRQIDSGDRMERLGGPNDKPVVGDWDGDGKDEIGLYRRGGQVERRDGM